MLGAAEEEVVAKREDHVDVGFFGEPAGERRDRGLDLGAALREELLRLVDDDESFGMACAPASESLEQAGRFSAPRQLGQTAQQPGDGLGVSRGLRRQRLRERQGRIGSGRRVDRRPSRRLVGEDAGAQERRLANAGGPDHGEKLLAVDLLPQRADFVLAAEEVRGVGFREGRQAGIGTLVNRRTDRRSFASPGV